jgi:1-deoxy-D-xylulose-5-phosphate synthase
MDSLTSKTPLLDKIHAPSQLRDFSTQELVQLCSELRADLIEQISKIGGHFASSLGVVELTVALHAVFDTPKDRIVWDVGHQAYIHKILTGRRKEMPSIRQLGGLSGFPRRAESEYDSFGVAHAGTSISAAFGMLEASDHDYPGRDDRHVVAVIGDGGMTAGMVFEALNHAGQLHKKLIVILNDNEMSIAPNVGALSLAFSKAITNKFSTVARKHFKSLAERGLIPRVFYNALDRAEEAAQGFLATPAMLFGSFGFRYLGPIDGHDMAEVVDALERAKQQDGPVVIHAMTVKGKGYQPAELDPVKYHGVTPFEVENGVFKKSNNGKTIPPSYTDVFGKTLVEICKEDSRVVGITAAMPDGTGLKHLAKEMPERYYDVGIAEQHAVTFAAGLACEGMRPVCAIYSTFLQRGYDQVVHDVCIQSLPVVFAMDRAGLVGADGPTHHGTFDIAFLRTLPNLVLMAPKDEAELRDMLHTAINYELGPIALRFPRGNGLGVNISNAPKSIEIGRAEVLIETPNSSGDVLLIGLGSTVQTCLLAQEELSKDGISCSVLNARFVKPLDEELLYRLINRHVLTATVEDHALMGGFGSAILEFMADTGLCTNRVLERFGISDNFVEHGTQKELYALCGYDVQSVVSRVKASLGNLRSTPRSGVKVAANA